MDKKTIGTKVKEARKLAGLTQKHLAFRVNTTQCKISQLEKGNFDSMELLSKVCEVVGLSTVVG
jgi:transcriptional regulator with XRE-family HTH domain